MQAKQLQIRMVATLTLTVAACALLAGFLFNRLLFTWAARDVSVRARFTASFIQSTLSDLSVPAEIERLRIVLNTITRDERLFAVAVCGSAPEPIVASDQFPSYVGCHPDTTQEGRDLEEVPGNLHMARVPITAAGGSFTVLIVHDLSYMHLRARSSELYITLFFLVVLAMVSFVVLLVARFTVRGWASEVWSVLRGDEIESGEMPMVAPEGDFTQLLRELHRLRAGNTSTEMHWDEKTLRSVLNRKLFGDQVLVVSNREPYSHVRSGDEIQVRTPAGGLVTALEPILKASEGTWIAHGSGAADWEVVDAHNRVMVPPTDPRYTLRRVKLTEEEEHGFYYGFSNEGLWPLCHIAHIQPIFREPDWNTYRRVNEKFAEIVVQEARTKDPIILIQDFHFTLLPALLRTRLPNATIITFWHVPWPNPEVFGICPWRKEILHGLLGSTILGFHTRGHCGNFLETVAKVLEARIDRERSTIVYEGKLIAVQPYPISIEWPTNQHFDAEQWKENRLGLLQQHHVMGAISVAVGVDRLDYIKGIMEKLRAVERLLELHPEWVGQFVLLQIASPSRGKLRGYQHYATEVRETAKVINGRFGSKGIVPIVLIEEQVPKEEVNRYFCAADVCLISSLHDGMNLVAKEFVAARADGLGVLVLSQFAGASRSLPEALIVNPYNVDECARTVHRALTMPQEEQSVRMQGMRRRVQEQNIYWWAGRMLMDAAEVRDQQRLEALLKQGRKEG